LIPSIVYIRWRLFWSSLFAIVLAVGCFSLAQWAYAPSDDQCQWAFEDVSASGSPASVQPRVLIRSIIPKGAADAASLLDGDELIGIHDLTIPDYSEKLTYEENQQQVVRAVQKMTAFINSAPQGTIIQYTVVRNGQKITRPLELKKYFDAKNAVLLLTGIVAWAIGLLVVLSSPQRKVARHFYYLGAFALILAAGSSISGPYTVPFGIELVARLCWLLFLGIFPPMWFHFFLMFPYGFEIRKYWPLLVGIYATNLLAALSETMVTSLTMFGLEGSDWLFSLQFGPLPVSVNTLASLSSYFMVFLLGAGVVLFWSGAFKISGRRRRALMSPLLFSLAVFLDLIAYLWLVKALAGTHEYGFFMRASYYFFLPLPLLPLTFAYAILRHGFFDVRKVIVRWLSYFIALGALIIAYLGAVAWLFVVAVPTNIHMAWLGVIMGLLALPLSGTLQWLLSTLRRRFKKDAKSAQGLILGGLRQTINRFSDDALLDSLVASIQEAFRPQTLLCLPAKAGRIVLPHIAKNIHAEPVQPENEGSQELRLPPPMLRHAKENKELVYGLGNDEAEWILAQSKLLRIRVDALGIQIMVLLMAEDRLHSVLLLGGKYAELNYSREDRDLMREVAIAAGSMLESANMHRSMIDKTRMDQELLAARNIQESLITSAAPNIPGFQIASRLVSAAETGGDLLWVKQRAPGHWIAIVGDVSGKGLPAAIYMSQSMALIKFATQDADAPLEKILADMDCTLRNLMSSKDFLTMSIIEWHENGQFKIVRAGHPPPIFLTRSLPSAPIPIMPSGLALGILPACSKNSWHVFEGTLKAGDWIAMYSDGITEAMDDDGNLYGLSRLTEQLTRFWGTGSPKAACEAIFRHVAAFESQNRDDRTLFILAREKHEN
jgi:serine phosphatase RsbU (regulator of sigma subunit)